MQALLARYPVLIAIWRTPLYRAATLSLFCAGFAVSATFPLLTLFFVEELDASLTIASLFLVTALFGPIVSVVTGRISDRLPSRLPLIYLSACWLAIGWFLMAVTQQMWMALAIGIVFVSFMGTFNAQLFAAVRDEITRSGYQQENQLVSTIRTVYALGWIVGPIAGGWFGLTVGLRPLLIGTAVLYVVSQLPFLAVRSHPQPAAATSEPPPAAGRESAIPLFIFAALCALAMSGDAVRLSFLPVYMDRDLAMPAWMSGAVISTQPLLELIMIPVAGVLADRYGASRILTLGVAIGALGHGLFAFSDTPWMLFLGQALVAVLVSVIFGLGITVAQNLYPSGSGFASSAFFGALGLSASAGGLIASVGVSQLGLPAVFAVPAAICVLTLIGFMTLNAPARTERRTQVPSP